MPLFTIEKSNIIIYGSDCVAKELLLVTVCAFVLTTFFVPIVKLLAVHIGAVDKPNARKVHHKIMPRMGGRRKTPLDLRRDPVRPGTPAPDGAAGRTGLGACHHLRERRDTGGGCLYDATALWGGSSSYNLSVGLRPTAKASPIRGGGIAQAMTERFFRLYKLFYSNPLPNHVGLSKINRDMRQASMRFY